MGPTLWNIYFADVEGSTQNTGGKDAAFADDLNIFQTFHRLDESENIQCTFQRCRSNVHRWGDRNRITFDASKEHLVILHPQYYEGNAFKFFGTLIDPQLLMEPAIESILSRSRPKIKVLLCTRRFYTTTDMLTQYKIHI